MSNHESGFTYVFRRLFNESGLTQVQLSERSGVSAPYISQLLNGKNRNPRSATLLALANVLALSQRRFDLLLASNGIDGPDHLFAFFLNNQISIKALPILNALYHTGYFDWVPINSWPDVWRYIANRKLHLSLVQFEPSVQMIASSINNNLILSDLGADNGQTK